MTIKLGLNIASLKAQTNLSRGSQSFLRHMKDCPAD